MNALLIVVEGNLDGIDCLTDAGCCFHLNLLGSNIAIFFSIGTAMAVQTKKSKVVAPQKRFYFLQVQNFTEEIGQRISIARRKLRLTQAQLAQKSQTSLSTYKRLEQGDMTVSIGTVFSVLYCLDELESCEGICASAFSETQTKVPRRVRAKKNKDRTPPAV